MTNLLLRVKLSDDRRVEHSPTRVSRATGKMATPSDGVVPGLFGVESSALGAAEDTVGRGSMHRNADSETDDDEDEELRPPLDIPLFAVEKVLAVRSRSKDPGGEVRRSSSTSSPAAGGSARASSDPPSGAFASEDDASGAAGRAPRAREGRRELVAAACTSEAAARPGDPPATRVFHAAAHASEEGTRHHLLLRAERVARAGTSEGAERASDADEKNARARFNKMLPWYEGEQARITSLEFSPPCCSSDADGPLLLCGTRGGGVYVIPAGAALRASSEDAEDAERRRARHPRAAHRGLADRLGALVAEARLFWENRKNFFQRRKKRRWRRLVDGWFVFEPRIVFRDGRTVARRGGVRARRRDPVLVGARRASVRGVRGRSRGERRRRGRRAGPRAVPAHLRRARPRGRPRWRPSLFSEQTRTRDRRRTGRSRSSAEARRFPKPRADAGSRRRSWRAGSGRRTRRTRPARLRSCRAPRSRCTSGRTTKRSALRTTRASRTGSPRPARPFACPRLWWRG